GNRDHGRRQQVGARVIRQPDLGDRHTAVAGAELEALFVGIEMRQPRACVAHADARAARARAATFGEWRVVLDTQNELATVDSAPKRDSSDTLDLPDTVLDRVLHDRLQNEIRHKRVHRALLNVSRDLEPPLEADLHDLQIATKEVELLSEGNLLLARPLDRVPQQFAQSRDHAPHATRIALDQG